MSELMDLPKALARFVPEPDIIFMNLKGGKKREELIADATLRRAGPLAEGINL